MFSFFLGHPFASDVQCPAPQLFSTHDRRQRISHPSGFRRAGNALDFGLWGGTRTVQGGILIYDPGFQYMNRWLDVIWAVMLSIKGLHNMGPGIKVP